jgi:MYXO-CTERM domain-containing protein
MRAVRWAVFVVAVVLSPVAAAAPTAHLSATPTAGSPPLMVGFDTSSSSVDGAVAEHLLFLGNGAALALGSAAEMPGYSYPLPGSFTAQTWLRQADGSFASSTAVALAVTRPRDGRAPPTAKMTVTATSDPLGFAFAARVTPPSGDSLVARRWDFGDGGSAGDAAPQHHYGRAGVYQVTLVATTQLGLLAFARQIVVAGGGGALAPSLLVAATPADGLPLTPVTVTAWLEGAPAGAKVMSADVAWPDVDDAAPAVTPTAAGLTVTSSHGFEAAGYYDVPVSVTLMGQSDPLTAVAHVMVARPDGSPPSPVLLMEPSSTAAAGKPYEPNGAGALTRGLLVGGAGPFAFGAAAPSPANLRVDDGGNVDWTPTSAQAGRQRLAVRMVDADGRELVREWVVDVAPQKSGCAFAAGSPSGTALLLVGLTVLTLRRRRRHRQSYRG